MTYLNIKIQNTETAIKTWRYLTQSPSELTAPVGGSVMSFLRDYLGFAEDYIDTQIKTIFINGKPVDDLYAAIIPEGARIGLGAIAPGVAGMTMCRNSPISALRSAITFENAEEKAPVKEGTVTLLLFNAIMEEKGLEVLTKGLTVPVFRVQKLIEEKPETIATALMDDQPVSVEELTEWTQKNPQLKTQLRVEVA